MNQNENTSPAGTIDTGRSAESQALIQNVKVFDNLDQNIIRITEDKMKLILIENFKKIEDKKAWVSPFGIFIALLVVFLTTEKFKDFLYIPAAVWEAGCYIAMVVFIFLTVKSAATAFKNRTSSIAGIISELKKDQSR